MSIELSAPDKNALQRDAQSWASRASEVQIVNAESCVNASYLLRSIKGVRSDIQRWFAPHVERAMETKRRAEAGRKALVEECDRMEAPLVAAELVVKRALLAWETQQEAARRAEEQRLQAEAQAHAERLALDAAAAMEREAVISGDAGMLAEANDLLSQPIEAPAVVVKTMTPKVQGIAYRDHWTIHPDVDVKALAGAVASGAAPVSFLLPNVPALRKWAGATQGGQTLAGVKVVNDRQIAARG